MAARGNTKEIGTKHFRAGVGDFPEEWQGVVTENGIGGTPINALSIGENIRKEVDGGWRIRRGLKAVAGPFQSATSCIRDIIEYNCDPVKLWIVIYGCNGGSNLGGMVYTYDPEQSPVLQLYGQFQSDSDKYLSLAGYGGKVYIGDKENLRPLEIITTTYGTDFASTAPTPPAALIKRFIGYRISCMQEFDGQLFVGMENVGTPANSKIISYDGITIRDDITGIRIPTAMCLWRDKLVVGFETAAGHIRYREPGAAPGTWTTVAAGGCVTYGPGNTMISWRDSVYFVDGAAALWKYDGTTLAVLRSVAGAASPAAQYPGIGAVAVMNDLLYYAWNKAATSHCYLGRYDASGDATEFEDTHKDITGQFPSYTKFRSMTEYRDLLIIGMPLSTLIISPGKNTAGTWLGTDPGSSSGNFPLLRLMVY